MPLISSSDIKKIQSLVDWQRQVRSPLQKLLSKTPETKHPRMLGGGGGSTVLVQAPAGGIPARVGSICKSALCKIVTIADSGSDVTLSISTDEIEVWNFIVQAVLSNGDRYGQATMQRDGRWWAISDDCHDTGP